MTFETSFNLGDSVKIVGSQSPSYTYKIIKIKKSDDGRLLYLLKSDQTPITLLYYESPESHLERLT